GGVQVGDGLFDLVQHLRRVLAAAHQDDALDGRVAVVLAKDAGGNLRGQFDAADVAHVDGRAADRLDEDTFDVGDVLKAALAADDERLVAARDHAAAGRAVVGLDGADHVG